jgi:hypothetical protein
MEVERGAIKHDLSEVEHARNRYGLTGKSIVPQTISRAEEIVMSLFNTARKMMSIDGSHCTIAFLLDGIKPVSIQQLSIQEHGEKYLMMRMLANEVVKHGADGVVIIAEAWMARYDPVSPYRRAADAPEKREYLTATLVTKEDVPLHLQALIQRNGKSIKLAKTEVIRNQSHLAFAPIYAVWGREIPPAWKKPFQSRDGVVGEGDAM